MKIFACSEAGIDCPFSAKAGTVGEAVALGEAHLRSVHPDVWKEILDPLPDDKARQMTEGWVREESEIEEGVE